MTNHIFHSTCADKYQERVLHLISQIDNYSEIRTGYQTELRIFPHLEDGLACHAIYSAYYFER
eukprot:6214178-Pleurochrysis_carterae.AAC.3